MTFDEWWESAKPASAVMDSASEWEFRKHIAKAAWEAAQPQWRPIETAPKDGRPVMLRRNIALKERISNGAYITDLTGGYWMWRHIAIGQPTHWMPLPIAPAEDKDA